MASSTTSSYGFAKRPGCNISTATYSWRTKTCCKQQYVDVKIANALLKKGTREAYKAWNQQDRLGRHGLARVARRGRIWHPQHHHHKARGVIEDQQTNARFVAFLGTFACPAQQVWVPGNDLQDSATWDAPPFCQLKRLHEYLLQHYDCTDQLAAAQPAPPSAQAAVLLPTRAQTCSLSTQAPGQRQRQTRSSAAQPSPRGIQAESGFPPGVLTSSPLGPGPFRRNAVSRSSSPSNGHSSRPRVSTTRARVLRSSASSTCLRSTRPLSRNPLFALR
jgi:hypothetical protein